MNIEQRSVCQNLVPRQEDLDPTSSSEKPVDRVGGVLAELRQHVRVGVHRHADLGVPEYLYPLIWASLRRPELSIAMLPPCLQVRISITVLQSKFVCPVAEIAKG